MYHWQDRFKAILSVYLVLLDEQGRVLLLKRQNTGYKDGEYGLPAGHVDGGEDLICAMQREAMEEVGVTILSEDLTLAHVLHRNCGDHERVDFFFTCRAWQGDTRNCEEEKCSELRWAPWDQLPDDVIDYYLQAFEHINRGQMYSHHGWNP